MKEQIITHKGKKYKVIEVIEDFKTIKFKGKEIRIYIWEDKPIKDFIYPKEFKLIEHSDFIELFDNKLINSPKSGWEVYFTKHYSKRKQKENILSRVCLIGVSVVSSYDDYLQYSDSDGRVVVIKEKEK